MTPKPTKRQMRERGDDFQENEVRRLVKEIGYECPGDRLNIPTLFIISLLRQIDRYRPAPAKARKVR